MHDNHLKLNDSKTEVLVIGNNQLTSQLKGVSHIKIGNTLVKAVDEAKNIGSTIDSQLDMEKHVNAICRLVTWIQIINNHMRIQLLNNTFFNYL